MDRAVRLPIVEVHVSLHSILGLISGACYVLTLRSAGYIELRAHRMRTHGALKARMLGHVGIDAVIGFISLVDDLSDIGWRANTRNAALLQRHFERHPEPASHGTVTFY